VTIPISKNNKQIAIWLITGCILVATMVIIGGITRLTHSGLSMVTWKPVTGMIPPLNELEWEAEFSKYKTSPEYIKKNYHFSLAEFKDIFFWEYLHRLIGRIIGFVFLFPFIYFLIKKKIKTKKLRNNLIVIFILGGLQGFVGWYMVKSGLVDNPNVSHYRLAIHLVLALFLFSYIYLVALKLLYPNKDAATRKTHKIFKFTRVLLLLTTLQIIYGAFVAGLKAGKFFPTYPKMGTEWMPKIMSESLSDYGLIALIDDPFIIQFIHRWIAVLVLGIVIYIFVMTRKSFITLYQKRAIWFLFIGISIQFLLGVFTILYSVPVVLGVLHQFGALVFLTSVLTTLYFFKSSNNNDLIAS